MAQVDHSRMANAFAGSRWTPSRRRSPAIPACHGLRRHRDRAVHPVPEIRRRQTGLADRDRFILSAGHGSMLLYSLLYLTGNGEMTLDQIKRFRQVKSLTPGHPENFRTKGVETTTGPLGQGIPASIGMALAEKMLAAEFGKKIVDHHTYVLCSDGDLMEGVSQEAISLAGVWRLNKLIVLYVDNGISIDGPSALYESINQVKRFKSAGWATKQIDGQNQKAITAAIMRAQKSGSGSLIACKTAIGYSTPTKAGTNKAHGEALGADELKGAKEKLGVSLEPFSVPDDVLKAWREAGARGAAARKEWEGALLASSVRASAPSSSGGCGMSGRPRLRKRCAITRRGCSRSPLNIATRKSSEAAIDAIAAAMSMEFLAGSADFTGSNNNKAKDADRVAAKKPKGRFIHYGVREHGMAACMNGIFLHGGFAPNGATFLIFTDYARPAMRLAALMGTGVVYVMTHELHWPWRRRTDASASSISPRCAMPNMRVFRPCDASRSPNAGSWRSTA